MLKFAALATVIGMTFMACNDKKENNNNPLGPDFNNGELKATISGSLSLNFNASVATANVADEDFEIAGSMMSGSSMYTLNLVVLRAPGEFTMGLKDPADTDIGEASAGFIVSAASGGSSYYSISGTITVTSASSTRLTGSFQFTAVNDTGSQITVAQGTFDVPINDGI